MIIRWTGLGLLCYVLVCAALPGAMLVASATYRLTGTRNVQLAMLGVAVLMLALAGLVWRVGTVANAKGAVHTIMGTPMQNGAFPFLLVAWLLPCVALGQVTTAVLGWIAFFSPALVVIVVAMVAAVKQHRALRADEASPDR